MAITDGVLAIAATIMVLTLVAPEHGSIKEIMDRLPTLIAYAISYLQVFLTWHEHHDAFEDAKIINHRIFLLNCVWLFFVTLLPFATAVVGNDYDSAFSVRLYILVLFLVDTSIKFLCDLIVKVNQRDIRDSGIIHLIRRLTFAGYAVGIILTFIMPILAVAAVLVEYIINLIIMWRYDIKMTKLRAAAQENADTN